MTQGMMQSKMWNVKMNLLVLEMKKVMMLIVPVLSALGYSQGLVHQKQAGVCFFIPCKFFVLCPPGEPARYVSPQLLPGARPSFPASAALRGYFHPNVTDLEVAWGPQSPALVALASPCSPVTPVLPPAGFLPAPSLSLPISFCAPFPSHCTCAHVGCIGG